MKFYLLSASLVLFMSACSSTYKIPAARFFSPESEGEMKFTAQGGPHALHVVDITENISTVSVDKSAHAINPTFTAGGDVSFGALEHLDFSADIEIFAAPMLIAKYQLIGDSKRKATPGNFSFSLLAGVGENTSVTETGDTVFSTTQGSIRKESSGIWEAGAVMGYRNSEHALFSLGASILWQEIKGQQTLASGSTSTFDDHPRFTEFHLGGYFTTESNTKYSFILNPTLQWGWLDTFGKRTFLSAVQMDFGIQF